MTGVGRGKGVREDFQNVSFRLIFRLRSGLDKDVPSHLESMCKERPKKKGIMVYEWVEKATGRSVGPK